jgi:hypothetical protein
VGDDAKHFDESVRRNPRQAYDIDFIDRFVGRMKSPTRRLRRLLAGLKRRLGEHRHWRSGHPRRA